MSVRRFLSGLNAVLGFPMALALALAATVPAAAQGLPTEVEAALTRAGLPRDTLAILVADADGRSPPRVSHRATVPVNPASLAKLATTFAALDLLGPAWTWSTPVYVDGPVREGVLQGNLYVRGQGDPRLVVERLWLLLRRVQGLGIRQISGDIVLDRSAFEVPDTDPGAFDGEPLRPYNAAPDALLINYKSLVLTFTPDRTQTSISVEPGLAGVQVQTRVASVAGDCGDWRSALKADFSDPLRIRFAGAYPLACGERLWPVAYAQPRAYAARAVAGLWQEMGGKLGGQVREGRVPAGLAPAFEQRSAPLSEVIRDINKFSNNVMAEQVFLTLSLARGGTGNREASRGLMRDWWRQRIGGEPPALDNGSGLSREAGMSAEQLGRLLQAAWASGVMPEYAASLPIAGADGTLRRMRTQGAAHLKTGSLRDVAGVAGYVDTQGGRRLVLVAVANHPNAAAARPAIDALVDWASRQP